MKNIFKVFSLFCLSWFLHSGVAQAQAIKTNIPFLLAGTPNAGIEWNIGSRCSISGDGMWMPYMWMNGEEVFKSLILSADFRYYVKPKYYYTNKSYDGFYLGPYVMWGNYNVGTSFWNLTLNKEYTYGENGVNKDLIETDEDGNIINYDTDNASWQWYYDRYVGWGLSAGVVLGYRFFVSNRLRLDLNLNLGYVYFQYAAYKLGSENGYPHTQRAVSDYIGPTKFGINLCYIIFK